MKKLLLLLPLLFFISCSSSVINDAKISGAKKLGDGTAIFMDKEYKKLEQNYTVMNCAAEAVAIGEKVRLFAEDKLKVKKSSLMSLSVGGEIAKVACGMVANKYLPEIIGEKTGDFPCFGKRFSDFSQAYMNENLCNSIEF